MKKLLLLTVLALAGVLALTYAQEQKRVPLNRPGLIGGQGGQGGPGGPGGGPGGPGGEGGFRPPKHPLEMALDANGDGVIDEKEIANAVAALKKLDKNGDGILSKEEIANAAAALQTLDKNGDGQITMDEVRPQMRVARPAAHLSPHHAPAPVIHLDDLGRVDRPGEGRPARARIKFVDRREQGLA